MSPRTTMLVWWWMLVEVATVVFAKSTFETMFVNQKLHHFAADVRTEFKQRYYWMTLETEVFPRPAAAKMYFLYIHGESELTSSDIPAYIVQLAETYGAFVVALEHRFYGQSVPKTKDLSTKTLQRLLTAEQAIEDAAYILPKLKIDKIAVVFGHGYGGALAVWLRQRYPALFQFVVASTPTLQLSADLDRAPLVDPVREVPPSPSQQTGSASASEQAGPTIKKTPSWCSRPKKWINALLPSSKKTAQATATDKGQADQAAPAEMRAWLWQMCSQLFFFSCCHGTMACAFGDIWANVHYCNDLFDLKESVLTMKFKAARLSRRFALTSRSDNVLIINDEESKFYPYALKENSKAAKDARVNWHGSAEEFLSKMALTKYPPGVYLDSATYGVRSFFIKARFPSSAEGSVFSKPRPADPPQLKTARKLITDVIDYYAVPLNHQRVTATSDAGQPVSRGTWRLECDPWYIKPVFISYGAPFTVRSSSGYRAYPNWHNTIVSATSECYTTSLANNRPVADLCMGKEHCDLSAAHSAYAPLPQGCRPPYEIHVLYTCVPNRPAMRCKDGGDDEAANTTESAAAAAESADTAAAVSAEVDSATNSGHSSRSSASTAAVAVPVIVLCVSALVLLAWQHVHRRHVLSSSTSTTSPTQFDT